VFIKLLATADHCMGSQHTSRPLNYHNIPLSCGEHAVVLFSAKRRKIVVKLAINHFFLATNLKSVFLKQ
jgi:hypothetical protein